MADVTVETKLEKLKKIRKILLVLSVCATVASIAALIAFHFMPAFNLTVKGTDKFGKGFDYPGWQAIYYGIGIQFIPGYYEFGFNIWTCLGMVLPLILLIVGSVMYRKGKNKRKAVLELLMGASLIFSGLIWINCHKLAVLVASREGLNNFKEAYLLPAVEAGTFTLSSFPKILTVVCFVSAIIKIGNAIFLLYQKSYAKKNKPVQK